MNKHALSSRERQLIEGAAAGKTDAQIARELGVTMGTVATYWVRIRAKYGGCSRTELVAMALHEEFEARLAELNTRNAELRHQLMVETGALEHHGNLYQAVYEGAPEAILILKSDATIEFANSAAQEFFGYASAELVGQPLDLLIPARFHTIHQRHVAEYLAHPKKGPMRPHLVAPARHRSGKETPILALLSQVETDEGPLTTCFVHLADE